MIEVVKTYYVLDDEDRKELKKQMRDLGLSLIKLAKIMDYSVTYLYKIFKGDKFITQSFLEQLEEQGIVLNFDVRKIRKIYH